MGVVPLNGGTQKRPQNDIILVLRATRRHPNLGKPPTWRMRGTQSVGS